MKRILLAFFVLFNSVQLQAADYYWVGGGGNWSDLNGHWRLGSPTGGVPSIVPAAGDNVFFGAYSGFGTTAATRTVTLDANAFCNNMTWESDVPNNPILARSGSNTLFVSGNLVLTPSLGYEGIVDVEFIGSNPATLTTNGPINAILNLTINKPGSGLTLTDDLIYTGSTSNNAYGLILTAGYLDASNRNVAVYSFLSENSNPRHLDITGGRLSAVRNFYFRGANKTVIAEASFVQTGIRLVVDGGEFDEVEALSNSPNNDLFAVDNTTFRKLTFSHPSLTSNARIHANNTVDTLIFMGGGVVRNGNNTIKHLSIAGNATIGGANNIIQYAEIGGTTDFIENGGHVIDTLLTAPNKNIYVTRTITINKYFRAGGEPCDGFTEISGYSGGTIHFADDAEVEIDNVLLTGLRATGSVTPLTVNGIDNEGNNGFIFNTPPATNRTLYWVGGAGDWNDRGHWSESSGGPGGACIPFIGDDVVFDDGSGLNTGATVATSGNTYCHNMTWAAGIAGSPIFAVHANFLMQVYGSVVMSPSVTMNARLDMRGIENATVTTNGNQAGTNRILIRKEAGSGVTLLDDWRNTAGIFQLNVGYLDIAGRTIDINIFTSGTNGIRHVDMEGATATVNRWEFSGSNKTLAAEGSLLTIKNSVSMANALVQYDVVDISAGPVNTDNFSIEQAGFRELTFSNPSLTSSARIGANNLIDRLEFKGRGTIAGTGNQIGSLITAENRNLWFGDGTSNTINEYFKAVHPECSGLGEIRSLGTSSTVLFGADATVEIANVYMENIVATGGGGTLTLPIAFSGADAGGNTGWNIVSSDGDARYWVGGAGDWNDASHWSTTSGGLGGACIPTVANDVYFDANSGFGTTTATRTITISNGNAYFGNISWAGVTNNPILNKAEAWNMEAWGETMVLNPTVTLNAIIQFRGTTETTITGQALGNFDMELRKSGGGVVIANDFSNSQTDIFLYQGSLEARNIALNIRSVDNGGRDNNISVDITGSTVHAANLWEYNGSTSNRSLLAADSKITTYQFHAVGFAYGHVEVTGVFSHQGAFSNITASKMVFLDQNVASNIGINGTNNQLDTVEFKGGGTIYGTNNTIGTLIFFPGSQYTFVAGTNTIITDDWFGSGTPCKLTEIRSSTTSNATITKVAGEVNFDYVRLQRITATGGGEFTAGSHSQDLGGSSGWDIAPYDGASPIEGLGPDVSLSYTEFPYTISAAGFFGSPLSRYEWRKDGTVVGTADELVITEPGEYTIKVDFPDGCSVTDEIVISLDVADLVTVKTLQEATQTSYVPGEEVVYTITITNNGPDDAVDVSVADEAPEGTAINGWTATATSGTVDLPNASGTGTLSETIPLLPNGAVVVYEITLATGSGRTADLSNTVEVTSVTPDPEPDCDACTTTPIPAAPIAAISVTKELADDTQQGYIPGDDVIYIITVTNDGPSDAREVTVEDTAPTGSTIGSWIATVTAGEVTLPNTSGTDELNETIAVLPVGAVVNYEVTVRTSAGVADDLVNTAAVTSDTEDPDAADNTVSTPGLPAVPEPPVGADVEECAESPVQTLTATATVPDGVTIVWYDAATGGDEVANPILGAIGTVTYYAEARKGTLASVTRTAVTLTINELPNLVITDPAVVCGDEAVDLTAVAVTAGSDAGLTYTYFADAAGTSELADPDAVTVSGTYYIKGTDPVTGCSILAPVAVQLVDRPVVTVVHPDCVVGTGSIAITQPLGAGFEYSINGTDYQADPTFENIAPGTYLVTARHVSVVGCVSDALEVTINTEPTTVTPTVVQPDCGNPLGQIIFPDNPDYEYAVYQTGETPTYQLSPTFADLAPGVYQVQMQSLVTVCEAVPVAVTIDEAPEVPVAPVSDGDQEECATAPVQTLTATVTVPSGVTVTWYDAPTGGQVVAEPTLNAVGTMTYYAEADNGECVSETRTAVTLTIHAQPVIDPMDDQVVCGSFTLPDITGTNLTGDQAYYTEPGAGGTRYEIGDVIAAAGTYVLYPYAATAEGCVAESSFTLTINETPGAGTIGADQSICYEETAAALTSVVAGTGTGTISYRWESSSDGTSWAAIAGASDATYQPDALTATMHYRRVTIATASGLTCESEPSEPVTVTVTGELIADAGADQTKYNNSVFTLDANVPALGTGEWSVVSTTLPSEFDDLANPAATVTLLPNTSVTLRWTVTEGDCSVFDEVTLTAVNGADVAVTKTLKNTGQVGYVSGSAVEYVIAVRNNGPAYAEGVRIQDIVPAGTTLVGWTAQVTEGTVFLPGTAGSDALDETVLILPNGAAVTYEVTIQSSAGMTDDLINTAEVSTDTDDADDANNIAVTAGLPSVPEAPVSGGDQESCAESPVQTLTAVATVPDGQTIVWYDAPTGGNTVATPTLNEIGTVTYYAEAVKGVLVSETRTAVTLTIHEFPNLLITDPAVSCAGTDIDLTAAAVTAGSDAGLVYTYYMDAGGTNALAAPDAITVSGTYYIRATDPVTGCSTVAPVTVRFVDRPVVVITHPDCVSGTGSIAITEPLGAGFEYSINGVDYQSDPLFEAVVPGTYRVTAQHVSVAGCVSEEVEVTINAMPTTYTPTVTHPGCGETTGAIEFPVDAAYEFAVYRAGETPAYQSSPVFSDLAPGEYLAQMRSTTIDCEALAIPVTIDAAPEVPAAPVAEDQTVCAESPVQALTAVATVPEGITVVWYDAATGGQVVASPTLDAVGSVTYYAEADNGECMSETRTAVTLTINALPNLVITDPAVACAGETVDLTNTAITAGSEGGLVFTYHTDAAGTAALENADAIAGSGTYYIRATDPVTGCSTVAPVTVRFVDRPVVVIIHPDCVSGAGSIAITEPLGTGFEYSINGVDYQSDPLFEAVVPGTYRVTAQHVSVAGCVSDEVEVTINAMPTTYTPTVTHPGCGETTGTIEFPADAAYEFAVYRAGETPAYQSSPVFADLAPGEYLAQMRSTTIDCEALAIPVTIDAAPEVPPAPVVEDQTVCAESPVQTLTAVATVPEGVTVVWYDAAKGGNVVATPTLDAVGSVTYYAEADNGECMSETRTAVTLTINTRPVIDPLDNQAVCGSFKLPEITGVNLTGDRAYYTEAGANGTRYEVGEVISVAGTHTLYQYATTTEGCVAESQFIVTVNEIPDAGRIGTDQSICFGERPAELTSVAAGNVSGTVSYRWEQSADGTTWSPIDGVTEATYRPEALETTTYYRRVTVAATDDAVCESQPTPTVTIRVVDAPVAHAGADQTAAASEPVFTLDGNLPAGSTGTWDVVAGTPLGISDIHDPNATVSLTPGTSITLRWTIGNGSCEATDEVVLTLLPEAPEVEVDLHVTKTVDNASPLVGSSVVFTIEVTNAGPGDATGVDALDKLPSGYAFLSAAPSVGTYSEVSGIWTIGALAYGETGVLQVTAAVNADGAYRNGVEVQGNEEDPDAGNNRDEVAVVPVHLPQAIDDAATGNSNKGLVISVLANDVAQTYPLDPASIEIVVQPQYGTVTIGADGTIRYVSEQGYVGDDQFTYRVKDSEGHWSEPANVTVTVTANPLRVPNIFTPNGDGQNDRFEIEGIEGFDRAELVVFNRWGNEVYRNNHYDNTWGGGDISEGTYYYMLTLHKGNATEVEKGWVVLKKQ